VNGAKLIDCSGHGVVPVLAAILHLFPLDTYVESPAAVMQMVPSDIEKGMRVPIWSLFQTELNTAHQSPVTVEKVERFNFYKRAEKAFAIVATGDSAQYANIILKKGIIAS